MAKIKMTTPIVEMDRFIIWQHQAGHTKKSVCFYQEKYPIILNKIMVYVKSMLPHLPYFLIMIIKIILSQISV